MMHGTPDEFSEYHDTTYGEDYTQPAFYQRKDPQAHSAYDPGSTPVEGRVGPTPGLMDAYRGPADLEGYTADVGVEQRQAAEHGKTRAGNGRKGLAGLGGLGAVLAALLKLPWLAAFAKFGFAGVTALVSVVLYSFLFGWPFAIGLVALLFLHEMGHAVVMKLKGMPVGGMIFIPMLGAAVIMRNMPRNAKDEAEVGIAGPIAGALAASVCLLLALQSPHVRSVWAPLAYFGFLINLFNLIPIVPFDGGRVLAAIDRRIWIVGFLGLIAFQIWTWLQGNFSPWLLFIVVMAATQLWARRSVQGRGELQAYYKVPAGERIILAVIYFGLAAVLFFGMTISHNLILGLT
jgi:Zn-dependent protease